MGESAPGWRPLFLVGRGLGFGLGLGFRRAGWFGFARLRIATFRLGFGFCRVGLLFDRGLIALAPIVRDVESAPFEDQASAAANAALDLAFGPGATCAKFLWADRKRCGSHRL